ncbi:MAG: nitrogenase [Clostridia bacterium]|nr:nitrogenase [Clostridia bacterium]
MAINLKSPEAPIRELRLGSITGYQGTVSDLCRKSQKGDLKEQERSFSQCATCASVTAICQLAMIQDAAVVNHAPLGCAGDFTNFNFINRIGQNKRGWRLANARLISSNLRESDTVFGGAVKLREAVRAAYDRYQPRAIFITTSCVSGIIGEDLQGTTEDIEEELGIPIISVSCEGFRSQIWASGFDAAYHAILRKVVKPAQRKRTDLVNIINFWGDDIFTELLGKIGLTPNYVVPFTTIEQLEKLSEAAATLQVCGTLGTYLAAGLEQHFGVPEVKAPPPYGIPGTDAWLRELGKVTGKEKEVEALIASEKVRIAPELAELRQQLKGIKAFVGAGAVQGHSIINVLNELELDILGGCVWHHDQKLDHGDPKGDSLQHIIDNYADVSFSICNKQSFEMVNLLNKLQPDIFIVRHNGMAVWGAKLGIPTFLMGDEHFGIGYQGLINYGQKIAETIANPAYVKNLAKYSKLPYTDWWLKQEPFAFLGKGVTE